MDGNFKMANKQYEFVRESLPEYFSIQDGSLYRKTNSSLVFLANFVPTVLGIEEIYNVFSGNSRIKARVAAIVMNKQAQTLELTKEKEFDIVGLDKIDFQSEIDYRCCVDNLKMVAKEMGNILRTLVSLQKPKRILEADKLGHFVYEGKHGFIAGNRVLGEGFSNVRVTDRLKKYSLVSGWKNVYFSDEVEEYVHDVIHFNDRVTPVLFTANILGVLYDVFAEAGNPIKFSLYVKGEQSTGKTTAVTYTCSMYNRFDDVESNLHNLTATDAKLNAVLDSERNMPIIIDDLRLSDSQAIMRTQEFRLDNLIRVAANNVGQENMRCDYDINGFCVFIGEYALKNPSTNNRIIMLEFRKEDLNKKKMEKITAHPENLSYFFQQFIEWSLKEHDQIVCTIREHKREYERNRVREEQYQERLQNHANTLMIAYGLFLDFCKNKGWNMDIDLETYERCIDNILTDQIECLELDGIERPSYVIELYHVVQSELNFYDDQIYKRPRKEYWSQRFYMDNNEKLIYLPSSTLNEMLESTKKPTSVYAAMQQFELAGLLKMDNSKKHSRTKKLEGKRCYVIDYSRWGEYVHSMVMLGTDDTQGQ
jgi:hypothetical protein